MHSTGYLDCAPGSAQGAAMIRVAIVALVSAICFGILATWLGPKMMRADLKSEARALEQQRSVEQRRIREKLNGGYERNPRRSR